MGARQNDWDDEPTCVAPLSREEIAALMRNAERMESGIQSKEPMPVTRVDVPRAAPVPEDLEHTIVGTHAFAASPSVDMRDDEIESVLGFEWESFAPESACEAEPFDLRREVETRMVSAVAESVRVFSLAPPSVSYAPPAMPTPIAIAIAPAPPRSSSSRAIVIGALVALALAIAPTLALISRL